MSFKTDIKMKDIDSLNNNTKFRQWKDRVESNGVKIKNVQILGKVCRGKSSRVFIDSELITPEGRKIPRCLLLSGNSVLVVPVLKCNEDNEVYTLMVEQRRVVDGAYTEEFPAGDLDSGMDPVEMACQEVREELNLNIMPDELIPLSEHQIKINPSYTDALAYLYYFERNVSLEYLKAVDGSDSGCHSDNEHIKIRVHKMSDVSNIHTSSAIIGLKLLEKVLSKVF